MSKGERKLRKRERADGRFQCSVTAGHDENGKAIRKVFYGRTKGEAEEKANEYRRLLKTGLRIDKKDMTLDEFIDATYDVYHYGSTTRMGSHYLAMIREDLGTRTLSKITEADVISAVQARGPHVARWYQQYQSLLKTILSSARKNKYISENPIQDLNLPRVLTDVKKDGSHRALVKSEQDFLYEHHSDRRVTMMAFCLMMTGMRIGEYEYLTWENIDFKNDMIRVRGTMVLARYGHGTLMEKHGTKTDAGMRDLPIPSQLKTMLLSIPKEYQKERYWQRYDPLGKTKVENGFASRNHRFVDQESLNTYIQHQRAKWNSAHPDCPLPDSLPPIRWHDLRHTYATMLYDAGVDPKTAQKLLGHASLEMTMSLYQHLSAEKETESLRLAIQFLERKR